MPGAGRGRRHAVDHRLVDPLRTMPLELLLQRELRGFALGEQHQARRIAIDPVHDERAPPAAPAQIDLEILEHRARVVAALQRQRHRQQSGRLVQHDQRLVFVDHRQIATRRRASSGAWRCPADRSTNGPRRRRRRAPAASASVISRSLTNTLPRSSAAAAFGREPARSGAARYLSRRSPTSPPPTVHSGTLHDTCVQFGHAPFTRSGALPSRQRAPQPENRTAGDAGGDRGDPARPGRLPP